MSIPLTWCVVCAECGCVSNSDYGIRRLLYFQPHCGDGGDQGASKHRLSHPNSPHLYVGSMTATCSRMDSSSQPNVRSYSDCITVFRCVQWYAWEVLHVRHAFAAHRTIYLPTLFHTASGASGMTNSGQFWAIAMTLSFDRRDLYACLLTVTESHQFVCNHLNCFMISWTALSSSAGWI